MCPYLALVGCPQTINESNYFCTTVLKACDIVSTQSKNAVMLNVSRYGIACEVQGNLILIIQYLNGEINYVVLVDTNHNINNFRYQLLGGLSPAYFGLYVFDLYLLKLDDISQKLWIIEDYASDAIVL